MEQQYLYIIIFGLADGRQGFEYFNAEPAFKERLAHVKKICEDPNRDVVMIDRSTENEYDAGLNWISWQKLLASDDGTYIPLESSGVTN
jgi:hypothetical protein